jgi:hypothetical protein
VQNVTHAVIMCRPDRTYPQGDGTARSTFNSAHITPNDLYGDLFTNKRGNNTPAPQLDIVTVKAAIMMDRSFPHVRYSIFKLIADLAGEGSLDEESQRGNPVPIHQTAKGAALRAHRADRA